MSSPSSFSLEAIPAIRILSNGRYTVMVHGQGGGFSRFDGWALNDWNGDRLQEQGGWIIYVRDLDSGAIAAFGVHPRLSLSSPLGEEAESAQFSQRIDDLTLNMHVHVAAAHPCEVRQLTLTNHSGRVRRLQVSAFLPIALNHPAAHAAHPAFSKLFVQTEYLPAAQALLARRRPRAAGERAPCMAARLIGPGELRWDTDRARFLGRGWGLQSPQGVVEGLAAHHTNVLDPAFVLQRSVVINASESQSLTLVMGAAESRDEVAALMQLPLAALASATPISSSKGVEAKTACRLQALAGAMFYGWPAIAAPAAERQSAKGHPGIVWGYGMPTDKPFVLVTSKQPAVIGWASQAKRYWQSLALDIPMLVLVEELAEDSAGINGPGLVVRKRSEVSATDLAGLRAVAACIVDDTAPSVVNVIAEDLIASARPSRAAPCNSPPGNAQPDRAQPGNDQLYNSQASAKEVLQFYNGYGGFSADGCEYVVRMPSTGQRLVLPPVPWVNVLANPDFGCLVSETGAGSTWSVNSRERRITPWSNDPVLDPHDEAFYLRDNVSGECWSPLPGPALSGADYEARHGFGYTRFAHVSHQLDQQTTVFVHRTLPVKITRLQLRNLSSQSRRMTVVAYQRLVLGFVPTQSSAFVATKIQTDARTLTATNRMGGEFAQQFAFASCVSNTDTKWQAGTDRAAFLGEQRDIVYPVGLYSDDAFATASVSSDPCFAQKIELEIPPQGELAVSFLLGDVASEAQLQECLQALNTDAKVQAALADIKHFWQDTLTAVQVETPSTALNFMLNGWLLYQTLVCRVWGRTAFYQSSGAFGFRDQLQDSGALIYARPDLTRRQILLHASRQFVEGDVQHWWHEPPVDRGLRTRFSDDLNWLPLLTAFYIKTTGDAALLDEQAPFLTAPLLASGEDEVYLQANLSGQSADIYEHCCRALDISLTKGVHGLPLMGTGDWNDGMNRVGREGKGESVWMGFFLYHIIGEFLPFCEKRQDVVRVQRYREYRDHLAVALNSEGWDGEWYRRAWYDNGNPVGSKDSDECQIDALAQAWAVISGVAPAQRADQALQSLEQRLVDPVGKLIRLLAPSFINTPNDPGYIKGYVAGVRENGGQYTHAASWVVRAMAERGNTERALALLEMILPVAHTSTREDTDCYKTEPYVAVADIYGEAPHVGRGGWTWYTGSSGWLYRVGLESVLGITLREGNTLQFQPCVPNDWDAYAVRYRLPQGGVVDIKLKRHPDSPQVMLNGQRQSLPADGPLCVRIQHPEQNQTVEVYWSA